MIIHGSSMPGPVPSPRPSGVESRVEAWGGGHGFGPPLLKMAAIPCIRTEGGIRLFGEC